MTNTSTDLRSVIVERDFAYPPEKIWRALTLPHFIEE
ncbi:SRPBCC family protein [Sphingobium nicotianae]